MKYTSFLYVLLRAEEFVANLRWSYQTMAQLKEMQHQHELPAKCLKWISMLAILQRLNQQQCVINKELGFISPHQWLIV